MVSQVADSLIRLVAFLIDGNRYGLPLERVERVLPFVAVAPLPKAPASTMGVVNLHGQVVPVLDVRRRFGFPPRGYGLSTYLVIARSTRRVLALPVDEALGVVEANADAVKPPDSILPGIGHVAGVVALPDGLLLIHDLDAFFSLEEERQLTEALEGEKT